MLIFKKRNYLIVFNCLLKLFEVDFLKKIRYDKFFGFVYLYIVNVFKFN